MVMLAMMRTPDPNERSAAVLPPIMSARAGHMQQQAQEEAELRQDAALQQEMSFQASRIWDSTRLISRKLGRRLRPLCQSPR